MRVGAIMMRNFTAGTKPGIRSVIAREMLDGGGFFRGRVAGGN
jgi:hypothetical protein